MNERLMGGMGLGIVAAAAMISMASPSLAEGQPALGKKRSRGRSFTRVEPMTWGKAREARSSSLSTLLERGRRKHRV